MRYDTYDTIRVRLPEAEGSEWRDPQNDPSSTVALSMRDVRQVTVLGQVVGASGMGSAFGSANAHCTFRVTAGGSWTHVVGEVQGSSQCDKPTDGGGCVFGHPIDVCFEGPDLGGWPRVEIEVRARDAHGRSDVVGYAIAHVPAAPGMHTLSCPVWQPRGSFFERVSAFFIGGHPQLKDISMIYGRPDRRDDTKLSRGFGDQRLSTAGAGVVHLSLSVCVRTLPESQSVRRKREDAALAAESEPTG